jgi:DNA-binding GntR family transcriptional regulator
VSMSAVDPDRRLYMQISDALRSQIKDGTFRPGKPMPSLGILATSFAVSRRTTQHALQVLADEGLAWLVPGLGYFVCEWS